MKDTKQILELLTERLRLCEQVLGCSLGESDPLDDPAEVQRTLRQRQQVLGSLHQVSDSLADFQRQWEHHRETLPPELRSSATSLMERGVSLRYLATALHELPNRPGVASDDRPGRIKRSWERGTRAGFSIRPHPILPEALFLLRLQCRDHPITGSRRALSRCPRA